MTSPGDARSASFWLADLDEPLAPRPALDGEQSVDVAIVGAGYTGLWTAYYLAAQDPALRIAIVEAEIAGYGASGRNGGWCTAHHVGVDAWARGPKREGAIALQRAMFDTVDEVGRVAAAEGIDCDYVKSGYLNVARNAAECARVKALVAETRAQGFTDEDFRWLDPAACEERVRIAGVRGGLYSPHCAALHPAKLARGLARAVEARGVTLYERSPARALAPGEVATGGGRLRARAVLRCTEGYTGQLPGCERQLLPLHTMMVATEPLPETIWKEIGADDRVLFGDVRRLLTWAQRTADGRIAIGAGGRYFRGSRIHDRLAADAHFRAAEDALRECFPSLGDVEVTHRWVGTLGVPRDWKPFVRFDASSGLGAAGGYVGSGVAASNLAGRTLADLVAGRDTDRTHTPWVQHRTPSWEPEPLRGLAVSAMLRMAAAADRGERTGRPARLRAALFDAMAGH